MGRAEMGLSQRRNSMNEAGLILLVVYLAVIGIGLIFMD